MNRNTNRFCGLSKFLYSHSEHSELSSQSDIQTLTYNKDKSIRMRKIQGPPSWLQLPFHDSLVGGTGICSISLLLSAEKGAKDLNRNNIGRYWDKL